MKKHLILFILTTLLFTGCAHYPMGLNEEQWLSLSQEEQIKLQIRQSELDERKAFQREKQRVIQEQRRLEQERSENARIESLYEKSAYGDIITVNFYKGFIKKQKRNLHIQPISITLARGEHKKLKIALKDKKGYQYWETIFVQFDRYGNELHLSSNGHHKEMTILNNGNWHHEHIYNRTHHYSKQSKLTLEIGIRYSKIGFRKKL